MNNFTQLPTEKQNRILNAAYDEFISSGFLSASTNRIIKNAEISKGSLFNYFGSKEALYLFMIKRSNTRLFKQLEPILQDLSPDLIERLRAFATSYLDLYINEPREFKFLMTLTEAGNRSIVEKLMKETRDENQEKMLLIFSGIDTERLNLDLPEVIKVITWVMTGLKEQILGQSELIDDPERFKEQFLQEMELLFRVLKDGVYIKGDNSDRG